MTYRAHPSLLDFLSCTAMFLSLISCGRETYTSWNCQSEGEVKTPMVLRQAQMKFHGIELKYCGSLGNQSYFDRTCTNQIEKSSTVFSPKTGLLVYQGKEYQCVAL